MKFEEKKRTDHTVGVMKFNPTKFEGAFLIEPKVFQDERGFFLESYSTKEFELAGIKAVFMQDNHAMSTQKGVLRGLHFQNPPFAQAKLVRVTKGSVYDVIVDIRKDSKTFGQWEGYILSAENFKMLYVPHGFAHGYCILEENTEFLYKADGLWTPPAEGGLRFNDPDLKIEWPFPEEQLIVNDRDRNWQLIKDLNSQF